MAIVEFFIGKSKYKIECPASEQNKLQNLAQKLNERVQKLAQNFSGADEKTLLVITALMLEEAVESSAASHSTNTSKNNSENNSRDNHADDEEKLSEDDIYDAISENIENVADYVEKLAKKIDHY